MDSIPDIKLIRTDTTLDLSQKAEKNTVLETAEKYLKDADKRQSGGAHRPRTRFTSTPSG
jgi:predicted PolB exonuclease-like 3'-5' exonuclease